MHFTTYEGVRVGYRKDGSGPALVLVHGTGGDSESNWADVTKELSKDYTVIRPDYAGSGETEDDGRELTVDYLSKLVLAAVDHARIESFSLAGFSLGAAVSTQIAADHPDRVSSLVLIAGFAKSDSRLKIEFELWRDLIASDRKAMARLILLTGFSPDALSSWGEETIDQAVNDIVQTQNWQGMERQIQVDLALDVRAEAERVRAQTLVIACTHDHMVPPAHSRALAASVKGSSYTELPTGHLAPMERPDLVTQEFKDFLAKA
ncbi:alpha/beta hydrolase [Labrenzia sp. CE80]|uniref:alpha/beta fold hydrolase n=1 Tax=Labrenzia sp. CE80 TaxID=1788986 RepID=UPI00129B161E|nr:alpha/beta hydrolase [Labrenzia sp. CE80]